MKKLFLSLFVLGLVLITVGCGSSKSGSIVGSWKNEDDAVVITFDANGNGYTKMENKLYDNFTYKYKDGVLTIKYQTVMETELKVNCEINGDTMTISNGQESYEYTRVKD